METCKCPDREYDETDFGETCPTCGKFRAEGIVLSPGDFVIRDQDDGSRPALPDTFEVITEVWVDERLGWVMATTDDYHGITGFQEHQCRFRRPTDEEVAAELAHLRARIAFIEKHWRPAGREEL